jgi:hypothetical protein
MQERIKEFQKKYPFIKIFRIGEDCGLNAIKIQNYLNHGYGATPEMLEALEKELQRYEQGMKLCENHQELMEKFKAVNARKLSRIIGCNYTTFRYKLFTNNGIQERINKFINGL